MHGSARWAQREAGPGGAGCFAAFLLKPIKASQLYDALVGILAEQRPSRQRRPARRDAASSTRRWRQRQPLRILLAEDNAVNQKLALRLLERLGYRADVAANGLEALQALRAPAVRRGADGRADAGDGRAGGDAADPRASGQAERRPRIIAMTANAMQEDREACLAAGMDDYLGKPIRVEELVAALSRVVPAALQDDHHTGRKPSS